MTEKETEQNMLMEFITETCYIDINKKIGVQGSDYYKPINTKKTTQTTKTNNNG